MINGKCGSQPGGLGAHAESGAWKGQSFIHGGLARPRRLLYMASLSAIRHNPDFVRKYQQLCERGKPRGPHGAHNTLLRQDRLWSPEAQGGVPA